MGSVVGTLSLVGHDLPTQPAYAESLMETGLNMFYTDYFRQDFEEQFYVFNFTNFPCSYEGCVEYAPVASADEDGDDVVTQTEYEALLAQIEANQAALDDMSSSALGAAMDIAQWQEDVESCASDILADDDDMRRQLLSHEQEEYDALEAENAKLRAAIKQEFLTKYS